MAILRNIGSSTEIQFHLLKSKENEWLNYRIEVYITESDSQKRMLENISLTNEDNLFLDAFNDPEIPRIINGLKDIISKKSDFFSFSPIDDRDFILEVTSRENIYVNFFRANDLLNSWEGIKIMVDRTELEKFITELNTANEF